MTFGQLSFFFISKFLHFFFRVSVSQKISVYEILGFPAVQVEVFVLTVCAVTLLGDWNPTFPNNVVVSNG